MLTSTNKRQQLNSLIHRHTFSLCSHRPSTDHQPTKNQNKYENMFWLVAFCVMILAIFMVHCSMVLASLHNLCVCASVIWIEESKHWMVTKDNAPSKTIGFGRFRLFTELRAKAWMREWESRDTRDWLPPFIMCIISWAYFIALNLRKTIIHGASNCNESSIVTMDHHQLTRNK